MPTALRGHVPADNGLNLSLSDVTIRLANPQLGPRQYMFHRKRCRRINDPGHAHSLTFSCFRRQAFLSKDGSRRWLIEAIDRARSKHEFHVWAYVIMPEHAHLLIWPNDVNYDISDILSSIKQSVAAPRSARGSGILASDGRCSTQRSAALSLLAAGRRL
jgi:REP element-mobilizing transposase RayT